MASSRRSTSVSTRLMKKLATLATCRQVDVRALGDQPFEPAEVGLHHLAVPLEAEDQRDVDAATLGDHLLDRAEPFGGAGDLDHQVAAVDPLVQVAGRGLGARLVVGEVRGRPRR